MTQRAVFLDRDGTLNREQGFITGPDELVVLPGTVESLRRLRAAGLRLVVVTNQSGIARGIYGETTLARIHERLHEQLERLPGAYLHCPHLPAADGPYGGDCGCRKPMPGLLHEARELLSVELQGSFLVGDSARDLLAGRGLPLRTVLIGDHARRRTQLELLHAAGIAADHVARDLRAATDWIVGLARRLG